MLKTLWKQTFLTTLLGISSFALLLPLPPTAWAKKPAKHHKAKKKRYYRRGHLYLSQRPFPLSASSEKELLRKARRHHNAKFSWSSGTPLRFQIFLALRHRFGAKRLYLVLFRRGKKGYQDARDIPVKRKMKRLVSWLSFDGSYLKHGAKYELRALKVRMRGKRKLETIVARTTFRLK